MMAATAIATLVAFHVDGYPIYSPGFPRIPRQDPRRARDDRASIGLTGTD